jgi:hypothetical protein
MLLLPGSALALLLLANGFVASPDPQFIVMVDSARHQIIILSGPYHLPAGAGRVDHGDHHASNLETPLFGFQWPVRGWFRGFTIEVEDGSRRSLSLDLLHHVNLMNLDRRQLIYQSVERLVAAGPEHPSVMLPRSVGIPLEPGGRLGLMAAWANPGREEMRDLWLRVVLHWTPATMTPRPLDVLPVGIDVDYVVGTSDAYDLPPGRSRRSHEFVMPMSGRFLVMGGHLHQHGLAVRLEEVESGRVLIELKPERDSSGQIRRMPTRLLGVTGAGLRLVGGRRYRLVGEYDSPYSETQPNAAMAVMAGIFAPDDPKQWPTIDPNDATFRHDLATLPGAGWAGEAWTALGK